jgi:hypothetical protein
MEAWGGVLGVVGTISLLPFAPAQIHVKEKLVELY